MMLNMAGSMEGLEHQDMVSKSAFMELQQSSMGPGMTPHHYPNRLGYSTQHPQHDVFTSQGSRGLPYPFAMNSMAPSYNGPPAHPFMQPYQPSTSPREGEYPFVSNSRDSSPYLCLLGVSNASDRTCESIRVDRKVDHRLGAYSRSERKLQVGCAS